ncbi:MAG: hypothetical protein ACKVGX_03395 [Alphaproteobacteria bacterium]|jgi:hypothetical protein|tara:strand:+ start:5786 stop:6100 length:315 start_codon:yes stop_codon:yes gene_type:complete
MISRFNLDVKRMFYYDDKEKFDIEFKLLNEYTNDKEISLDILEPQILIVFDAPLKVNLINKSFSKSMILHNFQSLSLVMGDKLVLSLNKNKIASYKLYKYLNLE